LFLYPSFQILSHFADIDSSRLIFGENWQQGGYMEAACRGLQKSDTLRMFVWIRNVLGVSRRAMPEALLLGMIDSIGGGGATV
jgi:hypothetical protein